MWQFFKNTETVYYLKLNNKTIARFTYFNNIDTAITQEHEYVKIALLGIVCKLMINNMHSIVGVNQAIRSSIVCWKIMYKNSYKLN